MLFQPSNIAPSTLSGIGIGTVDVTKGIDVSWQVNGDSPMTAYQITIYQNDTASTEMYTTGQISLGTPFQTHDVNGNPMFFSTSISAATLASAGIVNGYANGYKIIIKQWWGPSDFVEQTSASVFITRTTPTLSIDAIPNPVTTNSATITATYAQAEGDPISTVEWTFALAGLEDTPIKQTGAIGTQILSFVADGLISGNTYSIMCNVVSASGMEVSTGFVQFPVSYPSSSIDVEYQVAQLKNSSATYLSWTGFGKNVLAYPYADSTKTTNGITFTVNGEGDISVSGTATADAHFTIARGTLSQLGFIVGQKFVVSIGSQIPSAFIEITETNSSNVVASTITGSAPLQYVVPQTSNTISFDVVIPSGSSPSSEIQPMLFEESRIVAVNDLSVSMQPIQSLNGYDHPWPSGGGVNSLPPAQEGSATNNGITVLSNGDGTYTVSGSTGSSSANITFDLPETYTIEDGDYFHFGNNVSNGSVALNLDKPGGGNIFYGSSAPANRITAISSFAGQIVGRFRVYVAANQTNVTMIVKPMISKTSTYIDFAPYSNICPISGRTGLSVYVSPTQDQQDATTYSVDWTTEAGTVYGGTLDVVTGLLTVDRVTDSITKDSAWYAFSTGTGNASAVVQLSDHLNVKYVDGSSSRNGAISSTGKEAQNYWVSTRQNEVLNDGDMCFAYSSGGQLRFHRTDVANITDLNAFKAAFPDTQICYYLATPLTYQLSPQEVTLLAQSNIWSDSGDVTVSYDKNDGTQAIKSGEIVSIDDSMAQYIPDPTFVPAISGVSIYRYSQGDPILQKVYDITDGTTTLLDYYVPSQNTVSYLIVAHTASNDLFALTNQFTPTFWAYSILLCSTDANGNYHVRQEYAFRYGVETGAVSNNNNPAIQQNFTRYPTRQPTNSQYKTGTLKGYIGTVSDQKLYTDSVSLQNAIYDISTSQLTKFLKTRKGETIMIDCAAQIQMQTGDNMREQPLVATIEWVEVGSSAESSIVSVPSDSFWPLS